MNFRKPFEFSRLGTSKLSDDIFRKFGDLSEEFKSFDSLSHDREWQDFDAQMQRLRDKLKKEFSLDSDEDNDEFEKQSTFSASSSSSASSKGEASGSKASSEGSQSKVRYIPVEVEGDSKPNSAKDGGETSEESETKTGQKQKPPPLLKKSSTLRSFAPAHKSMGSPFSKNNNTSAQQQQHGSKNDGSKVTKDPQSQIWEVHQQLESLRQQVGDFPCGGDSKEYRYLDEMLTRCMLRLDTIDAAGKDQVRTQRKGLVKEAQLILALLESKLGLDSAIKKSEPMDTVPADSNPDGQESEMGDSAIRESSESTIQETQTAAIIPDSDSVRSGGLKDSSLSDSGIITETTPCTASSNFPSVA